MVTWPQIPENFEKGYSMCFGCGPDNPIGLKLKFEWDGTTARAEFTPNEVYQGWNGFLHGGIVTCILDEALCYAAVFSGVFTVTAKLEARLKRLSPIDEPLIVTSPIVKKNKRLIETRADICLRDGTRIAEGTSTQFVIKAGEGR